MTYEEAARKILEDEAGPLHYEEIAKRAIHQQLINPSGATPEATMASRLYTLSAEQESGFVRAGKGRFDLSRRKPGGIDAQVRSINDATRARLRELVAHVPPKRFEELVTELLLKMGFDETTLKTTPYRKDGGIDVVGIYRAAGIAELNAAVQVKRWKNNVQAQQVTALRGSLQAHQQGIIITTSDFSTGARKEAEALGKTHIGLVNGDDLIELLIKHHVGVVDRALTVAVVDEERWAEIAPEQVNVAPTVGVAAPVAAVDGPKQKVINATRSIVYSLFGERRSASTWRQVLLDVAESLALRNPETFEAMARDVHGRKGPYVTRDAEELREPRQIGITGLFVETHWNSDDSIRLAWKLLAAFGLDASTLVIGEPLPAAVAPESAAVAEEDFFAGMEPVPDAESDLIYDAETYAEPDEMSTPPSSRSLSPIRFTLFGEERTSKTWKAMLVAVAEELAKRHPSTFEEVAGAVHGRSRTYFARDPEPMWNPARVPGTDLYLETNLSAENILRLAQKLMAAFGHNADDLVVG
jgi:restriction system protein